ncbi:hypothetical protein CR513_56039, partial [Mucuna pruriens]
MTKKIRGKEKQQQNSLREVTDGDFKVMHECPKGRESRYKKKDDDCSSEEKTKHELILPK